jgi:hypothetical protein
MKQRTKISFNKPDFEEKIVKSLETIAVVDSVYPCDSQTKPGLQLGVRVNVGSFFFYYSELRGMDKTSHPLNWRFSDDLVGFSKQQTRNLLKILASRKTMLYTCSITWAFGSISGSSFRFPPMLSKATTKRGKQLEKMSR